MPLHFIISNNSKVTIFNHQVLHMITFVCLFVSMEHLAITIYIEKSLLK